MKNVVSLAFLQEAASKNGGECLSQEYLGIKTPLLWRCAKGHEWETQPAHIIYDVSWCPECSGIKKYTLAHLRAVARSRGGKCLSSKYKNIFERLWWECKYGHQWLAPLKTIRAGHWCRRCHDLHLTHGKTFLKDGKEVRPLHKDFPG